MAGPFYIDSVSGGDTDGLSWANAWISPNSLPTLASGEIVYVSSASVDAATYGGTKTWLGPTSGAPALIISVTVSTTTYAKATTSQFKLDGTSNTGSFDGSFAFYGIQIEGGQQLRLLNDVDETMYLYECLLKPGSGDVITIGVNNEAKTVLDRCTIDFGNTVSAFGANWLICNGFVEINEMTIANGSNPQGGLFTLGSNSRAVMVNGLDMSSMSNATPCSLATTDTSYYGKHTFQNILQHANNTITEGFGTKQSGSVTVNRVGTAAAPAGFVYSDYFGEVNSSTAITRTGGATFEGTAASWGITTDSECTVDSPFRTPWIYANVDATGTYTVDVYITHDANPAADFDDDEVWLEVLFKDDASSEYLTLSSDRVATRTTTPAPQTDDSSTWTGSGPSYTYKQKLSVGSLGISTVGLLMARVCFATPSIVSGNYCYVDPLLTVT